MGYGETEPRPDGESRVFIIRLAQSRVHYYSQELGESCCTVQYLSFEANIRFAAVQECS